MPSVSRRCVFYVSGFDPKGAGHYHGLYRDEAALQAKAGGLALDVGPRKRLPDGNAWWSVKATDAGAQVQTHYEFMRWDDVVRNHWPRNRLHLWRDVLVASWFNLRHGSWWRMFNLGWPLAVALIIPFLTLCGLFLGGPLLALLAGKLAYAGAGHWAATAVAVAAVLGLLALLERKLDARFNMYWLMRSYAFTRLQVLGRTPDLETRLDAHAAKLAQRLASGEDDEVLVVGHSSGAFMATTIVARALRLLPEQPPIKPVLSLLTLGQCLPVLGALPMAHLFRQELAELGQSPRLHWIDFSAPPDASCFALSDPFTGLGVPGPKPLPDCPKLLSPRFAEMFDAPQYLALRKDKFRMHFQYLMASAKPVEYDYFRITAGAQALAERFAALPGVVDYQGLRPFK
jgi:hypothetical protein